MKSSLLPRGLPGPRAFLLTWWSTVKPRSTPRAVVLALLALLLPPTGADSVSPSMEPDGPVEAILHLDGHLDEAVLAARGARVVHAFSAIPAVLVHAPASALAALAAAPGVARVEPTVEVVAHLATAVPETGARAGRTPGAHDALGVTGRDVTVAVVDFGVDATHPDLPYGEKVRANVAIAPGAGGVLGAVSAPDTDLAGGHGTHVAGIVAGTGAASDGRIRGVAPSATLVGVSIGQGGRTTSGMAAAGLDWAWRHADEHGIRIVTSSWGLRGGSAYEPDGALERLVAALHAKGVLVVFSVGNDGLHPDGALAWDEDRLSGLAMSPHALAVTSYDAHAMHLADTASRGDAGRADLARKDGAQRRPDLAAPGEGVVSAAALASGPFGPTHPRDLGDAPYVSMSGTSMAAPHVAGAAALVIEALESRGCAASPHRVAQALTQSARRDVLVDGRGGPLGPESVGHGALDAYAAVTLALTAPGCDLDAAPTPPTHPSAQPLARGLPHAYTAGAFASSPLIGSPTTLLPTHPVAFGLRWAMGLRGGLAIDAATRGHVEVTRPEDPDHVLMQMPFVRVEPEASLGFAMFTDPAPLLLPPGEYLAKAWLDQGAYAPRPLAFTVAPAHAGASALGARGDAAPEAGR